jgi:hypothetical protein
MIKKPTEELVLEVNNLLGKITDLVIYEKIKVPEEIDKELGRLKFDCEQEILSNVQRYGPIMKMLEEREGMK